jgi:hypothetical protein
MLILVGRRIIAVIRESMRRIVVEIGIIAIKGRMVGMLVMAARVPVRIVDGYDHENYHNHKNDHGHKEAIR